MKTSVKLVIVLLISLVIIGVLPSIANANTTTTGEELLQSIKNVLPEKITLDIPEVEYSKANELVIEKVKDIMEENNIDATGVQIDAHVSIDYLNLEDFYTGLIYLTYGDTSIDPIVIAVEYNNHSDYNSTDEQYVKSLKLETPEYITYTIEEHKSGIFNFLASEYQKQVNDESIKIYAMAGAGDSFILNTRFHSDELSLSIFKNGVLYDIRKVYVKTVCEMTVPSHIEDTEEAYANYAIPVIEELIEVSNLTLTKGAKIDDIEITNGYTVKNESGYEIGRIILNKEKAENIKKEDTSTGVKLETTSAILPSNVVLSVEKVTEQNILNIVEKSLKGISNEYIVYDITLLQDNVKIQPNGKVKISLPIPSDYDTTKLTVYRVEENGEKTEYKPTVDGGKYAIIETDHFSTYVLAEKVEQVENTQTSAKGDKDETPKTGTIDTIYYILPITVISALGVVLFKKKH